MSAFSMIKSVGGRIVKETGYPDFAQGAINILTRDHHIDIAENAVVERGVELKGEITLKPNARINSGSRLNGTITLAEGTRIGPDSWIDGDVSIGRGTNLTKEIEVLAARGDKIRIGRYNAIARRTTFQNRYRVTDRPGMQAKFYREKVGEPLEEKANGPIEIGNDGWIGLNTVVLSGVTIGHGAVIGAGAVVTKDVAPYAIVAGVPAEPIDWRFDESKRDQLLDIEWWDWNDEKIRRNAEFFRTNLRNRSDIHSLLR